MRPQGRIPEARLNVRTARTVFGGAAEALIAVQGAGFPLDVPLVEGLPLACPIQAGVGDWTPSNDMYRVFYGIDATMSEGAC